MHRSNGWRRLIIFVCSVGVVAGIMPVVPVGASGYLQKNCFKGEAAPPSAYWGEDNSLDYYAGNFCLRLNNRRLVWQHDGNLVVYEGTQPGGRALWATGTDTDARRGYKLSLQGDGNIVIYNSGGQALWASHTNGAYNPYKRYTLGLDPQDLTLETSMPGYDTYKEFAHW